MNTLAHSPIAVVGIGNVLMCDDGVGVHVIQELDRRDSLPDVTVRDLGTASAELLDVMLTSRKVVVVDAVHGGRAPGTIYRMTREELVVENHACMSSHESRISDVIVTASLLGAEPEVVVFGVEPARITPHYGLSELVRPVVRRVAELVIDEASQEAPTNQKGECREKI